MYRIRTIWENIPGTPWLSTMFFNEAAGTAQDAADAVAAFWGTIDAQLSSAAQWRIEPDVALIEASDGELTGVDQITPGTGTGGLTTHLLPIATQALLRWRTGFVINGRELRGRTFVPAVTEANCTASGDLEAALVSAMGSAATTLLADPDSSLLIWHRPTPGGGPGTGVAPQAFSVWNQFATLRSRRD